MHRSVTEASHADCHTLEGASRGSLDGDTVHHQLADEARAKPKATVEGFCLRLTHTGHRSKLLDRSGRQSVQGVVASVNQLLDHRPTHEVDAERTDHHVHGEIRLGVEVGEHGLGTRADPPTRKLNSREGRFIQLVEVCWIFDVSSVNQNVNHAAPPIEDANLLDPTLDAARHLGRTHRAVADQILTVHLQRRAAAWAVSGGCKDGLGVGGLEEGFDVGNHIVAAADRD